MRYKNTKTGAVIDSSFVISGGDWSLEKIEEKQVNNNQVIDPPKTGEEQPPVAPQQSIEPPNNDSDDEAFNSINLKSNKQELDAFGIEYDKRANKRTLYDLMMSHGK